MDILGEVKGHRNLRDWQLIFIVKFNFQLDKLTREIRAKTRKITFYENDQKRFF